MNIRKFRFAFILLFIVVAAESVAQTRERIGQATEQNSTNRGLQLSIALDKQTYQMSELAIATITLKNVSSSPIAIYKDFAWGPSASLGFIIENSEGQGLIGAVLNDAQDRPPFPEEESKILKPGESIEIERAFDVNEDSGISEAGTYRAAAWFHSPVWKKYAPETLPVWTKEKGTIFAKRVQFEVVR